MKSIKNVLKYTFFILIFASFLTPVFVARADVTCKDGSTAKTWADCPPITDSNPEGSISTKINNPLKGVNTVQDLVEALLHIVLVVGVPIVALAIIYTGFLFVKAQGKPEDLTKAKNSLMYTLIGAALLLGSWVIANAIGDTVKEIESTTYIQTFINLI